MKSDDAKDLFGFTSLAAIMAMVSCAGACTQSSGGKSMTVGGTMARVPIGGQASTGDPKTTGNVNQDSGMGGRGGIASEAGPGDAASAAGDAIGSGGNTEPSTDAGFRPDAVSSGDGPTGGVTTTGGGSATGGTSRGTGGTSATGGRILGGSSALGGATAAAVGERLARLAKRVQVLVITHSPQVAARGDAHWHVFKRNVKGGTITEARPLDLASRREEIARMLAGETVTEAARAAATSLLGHATL